MRNILLGLKFGVDFGDESFNMKDEFDVILQGNNISVF